LSLPDPVLSRVEKAKSTTYVVTDDLVVITPAIVDSLKTAARQDPLKRARLCLHRRGTDVLHQMIIVHHRDTYTHPHRHRDKAESFHMIEGRLLVAFFDDTGSLTRHLILGSPGGADPSIYRLSAPEWHSVIPLTEFAVFHEITSGPFTPGESQLAVWAPQEGQVRETEQFKQRLIDDLT